jgi:hypothetical protein
MISSHYDHLIKPHLQSTEYEDLIYQSHILASYAVFLNWVPAFGYLEKADRPDAGTSPAVGLQVETLVAPKDQTPEVLKDLEESSREIEILKLPHPWVTVVGPANYMKPQMIHGQWTLGATVTATGYEDRL